MATRKDINIQDIDKITYNIDGNSINEIITIFDSNKLGSLIKERVKTINDLDVYKFKPFIDFRVIFKSQKDNIYSYIINNGKNKYFKFTFYKSFEQKDSDLKKFIITSDDYYKRQYKYLEQQLELTKVDDIASYQKNKKKIQEKKTGFVLATKEIKTNKNYVVNKLQSDLEELIKNRIELINKNKNSYRIINQNSKSFYSNPEKKQKEEYEQYKEEYRKLLLIIEENKRKILELNAKIDILEKRKTLYLSEVYVYNTAASLYIQSITKEEYERFIKENEGTHLMKGGIEYELDYIDDISDESEKYHRNYYSKIKKEIKRRSKNEDRKSLIHYLENPI